MSVLAVIGHGPSTETSCLGGVIDSCDLVLRMHNCAWQAVGPHWGSRHDIGVLPGPRWRTCEAELHGRLPALAWWGFTVHGETLPETFMGLPVQATDMAWTKARLLRPGMKRAAPTRGMAAGLLAMGHPGVTKVVMIGCDRLRAGVMVGRPYTEAQGAADPVIAGENADPPKGLVNGPHHFGAEHDLLWAQAEERGIELEFLPCP